MLVARHWRLWLLAVNIPPSLTVNALLTIMDALLTYAQAADLSISWMFGIQSQSILHPSS